MSRRIRLITWTFGAALATYAAATGYGATDAPAGRIGAARAEFIAAMRRIETGEPDRADPPALTTYPLYEYLTAARLERDLGGRADADLDARIEEFLKAHAGEPVAGPLDRAWLLSLAARGRWDLFLPRAATATDPRLVCDRLAGRLAGGDRDQLAADALVLWLRPERSPAECAPVFDWLKRTGVLTVDLAELRTRAALSAGDGPLALQYSASLPPARAAPLRLWAQMLDDPRGALESMLADPALRLPDEAIEAGFARLSRRDGATAAALLPRLLSRRTTSQALAARLRLDAALGAAYDRDPGTLAAFANVPPADIDANAAQWRVRAALWAGDFAGALDGIARLPPDLAAQPRWRYWYARAVEATSGDAAARPLYAAIAGRRDFYGYLAADRLHRAYRLGNHPSTVDRRLQRRLAAEPAIVRARELFRCEMPGRAAQEWAYALAGADPQTLVQAAQVASRWGWYAETIVTLKQADAWDDLRLRYPRPFRPAVAAASRFARIPADWLFAVMRQESLFRRDAVSPAGARGLMQLRPETAALIARRSHLRRPRPDDLLEPRTALRLGAAYLRELLDRYDGDLALGLAAYNAGPGAVARWLPDRTTDADVWIENIPYRETREYVQRIVEHVVAYAWIRGAAPPRLSRLLPPIEPAEPPETPPGGEHR